MKNTEKDIYITIRVSKEMYAEIKGIAEQNTRSLSSQVLHFAKRCLEIDRVKKGSQND